MTYYSAILDMRPPYLEGTRESVLQLPLGNSTVLEHICRLLTRSGSHWPVVISPLAGESGYASAIEAAAGRKLTVLSNSAIENVIAGHELSDWLLVWDGRYFPNGRIELASLCAGAQDTGWSQHMVALDRSPDGTREYAQLDATGCVARIQRYYDGVTWVRAEGVVCSLAPIAAFQRAGGRPLGCLQDLRRHLAGEGAPSRDVPAKTEILDLGHLHEYLNLCHADALRDSADADNETSFLRIGKDCNISPTARIVGPVTIHDRVTIGSGATIVGPAMIGAGAQIEDHAMVAQSVMLANAHVAEHGQVLRSLVLPPALGHEHETAAAADSDEVWSRVADVPQDSPATVAEGEEEAKRHKVYVGVKRWIDAVLALIGLILLLPIMLIVAILIRREGKGPIFFGHEREGIGGKPFRCWKFRTMVENAHLMQRELYSSNAVDGPQFKMDDDPRVTRIGETLRTTNLDELPQLWNVLLGQMSLIGPRPSPFRENQICVPWRLARLSVRPGISGLWQVCRANRDGGDFHQWIFFDLMYVKHVSPWTDLKILVATICTLGGRWSVPLEWIIPGKRRSRRRRGSNDLVSYPFCRDAYAS